MTDERDRFGSPVTVDPARHGDGKSAQTVPDPRGPVGPESTAGDDNLEQIQGPLERFVEKLLGVAEPKEKPVTIRLSGDEQAHRLVSDDALTALAASVDRLLTKDPKRVETAPSEAISAERTIVNTGTAQRLVPYQPDRLRVRIRNRSGNIITIGQSVSLTDDSGFTLEDNDELVLETRAAVYAVADTDQSTVEVLAEFGEAS